MLIKVKDGSLTCLHHAGEFDLTEFGACRTNRASFIEPLNLGLRLLFICIRQLVSDDSKWAAWTRLWRCNWRVRVINGPTFGCFSHRNDAIAAEVRWIRENRL